jgi:hypothetical protein
MTRFCAALLACLVVLMLAPVASAQALRNPTGAEFTASPDHLQITRYTIGFFAPGATDPVQEVDVAPTCSGTPVVCTATINTMPLTFGPAYVAKVRAYAGAMASDWSAASNPFDRVPGPPGATTVKK